MGRLLGIDYGGRRVGIALSDLLGMMATPHSVVEVPADVKAKAKKIAEQIAAIAKEKGDPIDRLIVGLPLMMDGSKGTQAQEVETFVAALQELTDVPIVTWDERLTTSQAERSLKEMEMSRKKRKGVIDQSAATIILQSYMDAH